MRALTFEAEIAADRTLTLRLPDDVAAGRQTVVVVLADAADSKTAPLFLRPHAVGPTDPNDTYRRETLCGDDGR